MMRRGAFRWARVQQVYVQGGVPVADVLDGYGVPFTALRFLGLGGGAGRFIYAPPLQELDPVVAQPSLGSGAEVALFVPDGGNARPWIFGALMSPTDAPQVLPLIPFEADTDYTGVGLQDIAIKNGGGAVVVSPLAGPVISAGAGLNIRAQLLEGGSLRISLNGEALEGVLLAGPTLAYIDVLTARINALTASLKALETWAGAQAGSAVVAYVPLPGVEAPEPLPVIPATSAALESGIIKISSRSKAVTT